MKARVKATGEIVTIISTDGFSLTDESGNHYLIRELEEVMPDYWEKLKHQYAGMAMQGILANCNHQLWEREANSKGIAKNSYEIATALINELKEKEKWL